MCTGPFVVEFFPSPITPMIHGGKKVAPGIEGSTKVAAGGIEPNLLRFNNGLGVKYLGVERLVSASLSLPWESNPHLEIMILFGIHSLRASMYSQSDNQDYKIYDFL